MARTRTTKRLAQRIDLNYFKRPTALKRAKLWLSVGVPALAVVWIASHGLARDSRVYSSGRMSEPHAVLENECAACHVRTAGAFSAKANDSACLSCHDGPEHHAVPREELIWSQQSVPHCATCHAEHRGRVNLRSVSNQNCASCHSDLKGGLLTTRFSTHIKSFENGHPEFAWLSPDRNPTWYATTVNVNHAVHMKPLRRGPNGPNVQLDCANCHRPQAVAPDLTYSDALYRAASVSYGKNRALPLSPGTLRSATPLSGRELMAPVKFANACAGCHSLAFDKRFDFGVPHDEPEVVHAFLVAKFSAYVDSHPAELRETRDVEPELTNKPTSPRTHVYSTKEWVSERVYDAEQLLWRKTCAQCHLLSFRSEEPVPGIAPWLRQNPATILTAPIFPLILATAYEGPRMPHAKFNHDAHQAFSCVSCHQKALSSTEASDVLLPGIATCKKCHAPGPGHAGSQCSECHTYHDWSKRKEVNSTFTLPALRTGGR